VAHWWLANLWSMNPVIAISWVFWVIFSICCHELGHGYAAIRRGDDTPIATGHMTWNPVVHMGVFSLIMFLFSGIAWGAMPVSPSRLRGRHADAYVAIAGPVVNLIFFAACAVLCIVWEVIPKFLPKEPHTNIYIFLMTGSALNLVLFLFNLIPVPPLDGSRVVASFVPAYANFVYSEKGAIAMLVAFVLVFRFVGDFIFTFGLGVAGFVISFGVHLFHPN
jgi:hypothetical protein